MLNQLADHGEEADHRTTKVGRLQSNGFVDRFHPTLLEEHFRIKGRTPYDVCNVAIPRKPHTRKPSANNEVKIAAYG